MKQREPTDPTRWLKDLESIHSVLGDDKPADAQIDIPLLEDIITSSDDKPAPPLIPVPSPDSQSNNPFLPRDSLVKLAGERVQLERLLQQSLQQPSSDLHTGAREVRIEARLRSEAQLIMQDVIDEILPVIEAELRKRLHSKLEQIVQEQMRLR